MNTEAIRILERSAQLIEERGLCKGALTGKSERTPHLASYCSIGALSRASRMLKATIDSINLAAITLQKEVEVQTGFTDVPPWNDQPERTEAEVIDMFKHAIKTLENEAKPE